MPEQNLSQRLKDIAALLDHAIAEAATRVGQGPANPAALALPGGRGFTMRSSAFGASDNWSVFFHDWKAQYEHVKTLLLAKKFSELRVMLDGKSVTNQKLAPNVIEYVKKITGDLVT